MVTKINYCLIAPPIVNSSYSQCYGAVFLDYLKMPKNELGHYGSVVTILDTGHKLNNIFCFLLIFETSNLSSVYQHTDEMMM